ncbi:MAG: formylglycine-generating enzyme family protein [Verrucomicrobiota bacterium]
MELDPPEMVRMPGGAFVMGRVEGDKFGDGHEQPTEAINLPPFEMSRYPISVDRFPLVNVDWDEANDCCRRLGSEFRLPTEWEWEYGCRAGTRSPFPSGALPDPAEVNFLYDESGNRIGPGRLLPVGWGKPNAFGLHDMLGNVCEWTGNSWSTSHGGMVLDPDIKTIRGGAWDYMPRLLRPSWRDFCHRGTRRDNLGFRVVRDLNDDE